MASKDKGEIPIPDIPDWAVRLKLDARSSNIRIDEEPLLRALQKLKNYVKIANDSTTNVLRSEIESESKSTKRECMLKIDESVEEAVDRIRDELKTEYSERINQIEESVAELTTSVEDFKKGGGRGFKHSPAQKSRSSNALAPGHGDDEEEEEGEQGEEGEEGTSRLSPTRHATMYSPGTADTPSLFDDELPLSRLDYSEATGAESTTPTQQPTMSRPTPKGPGCIFSNSGLSLWGEREGDPEPLTLAEKMNRNTVDGEGYRLLQSEVEEAKKAQKDMQAKLSQELKLVSSRVSAQETEGRAQLTKLAGLDMKQKAAAKEQERLVGMCDEAQHQMQEMQEKKVDAEALQNLQEQVTDVKDRVALAASASVVGKRIDSLTQSIDEIIESCKRSDRELEAASGGVSELYSKLDSCSEQLLHVAQRTELDERCVELNQQCQGVSNLLMEVQCGLGDISAAVVALGSKAELSDLAIVRDELSMFAENIKEKEQSVLFGARCMSCNRVFDDVRQEPGAVDLPGERQRDALFSQVQQALHSPNLDPMTKIKMLAIKVGRPLPVTNAAGSRTFNGRDGSSFASGVGDVQLVPAVRGCGLLENGQMPVPRPATTPRPGKKRPQGATAWQNTQKDGPMDFKHPLSQLVDRSRSALG